MADPLCITSASCSAGAIGEATREQQLERGTADGEGAARNALSDAENSSMPMAEFRVRLFAWLRGMRHPRLLGHGPVFHEGVTAIG